MDDLARRTTQEVLDDHLRLATEGDLDADIERNCAADIVMLTGRGIFEGHDGVRDDTGNVLIRADGTRP